jgi:hypothetical protein
MVSGFMFYVFDLLWADATLALGGGNDMAIDDPSGGRDLCVFASLNGRGILREPQSKKFLSLASCFGWHNSTKNIHNRIVLFLPPSNESSFMSRSREASKFAREISPKIINHSGCQSTFRSSFLS